MIQQSTLKIFVQTVDTIGVYNKCRYGFGDCTCTNSPPPDYVDDSPIIPAGD